VVGGEVDALAQRPEPPPLTRTEYSDSFPLIHIDADAGCGGNLATARPVLRNSRAGPAKLIASMSIIRKEKRVIGSRLPRPEESPHH